LQEGTDHTAEAVRHTAGQVGDAVRQAPDQAIRQTQGSPLAAGLIAFGVGVLASSLLPTSKVEEQAASDLMDHADEALEPVKQAALESAQHLREDAMEVAQHATEEVKDTAADAVRTTQGEVQGQAKDLTAQARQSGRQVTDQARQ